MSGTTAKSGDLASCHPKPFPRSSVSGSDVYLVALWILMVFSLAGAYFIDRL